MTEIQIENNSDGKNFLRKHWKMVAVLIVAGILLCASAIYVFLWFAGQAQTSGLVPSSLGQWSMGNMVMFILHALFWELLFIGIPTAIGAIVGWQWWKRLPEEEKKEHNFGKSSKSSSAGGAISPLLFIAFAIKVYIDGNWNVAMATWNLDYVLGSMLTILIWTAAIFAIPAVIGIIWWIRHEMNKP
jgi:hypothetical protein